MTTKSDTGAVLPSVAELTAKRDAVSRELAALPLANEHRQRRLELSQQRLAADAELQRAQLREAEGRVAGLREALRQAEHESDRAKLREIKRQLAQAQAEAQALKPG